MLGRGRSRRLGVWAFAAFVTAACRDETLERPPAPSMTDVLEPFANPTAPLDAATASVVRREIDRAVEGIAGSGVLQRIYDGVSRGLAEAKRRDEQEPQSTKPLAFENQGVATLVRVCDGWGPEPSVDEAANGTLRLTCTFENSALDPVVWGTVERCLYLVEGRRMRIDRGASPADLRLFIGERTRLEDLPRTPVTLALDATVAIDEAPERRETVAVRFTPDANVIELLVTVPAGALVASIVGREVLRVRARNGVFECDPASRICRATGMEVVL